MVQAVEDVPISPGVNSYTSLVYVWTYEVEACYQADNPGASYYHDIRDASAIGYVPLGTLQVSPSLATASFGPVTITAQDNVTGGTVPLTISFTATGVGNSFGDVQHEMRTEPGQRTVANMHGRSRAANASIAMTVGGQSFTVTPSYAEIGISMNGALAIGN
jgi:hypothetical protein